MWMSRAAVVVALLSRAALAAPKVNVNDALLLAAVAVEGTPGAGELVVTRVLHGTLDAGLLVRPGVVRLHGTRFTPSAGVWLLARTERGYFAVNPTAAPLAGAKAVLARLPAAAPAVEVLAEDDSVRLTFRPEQGAGVELRFIESVLRERAGFLDAERHGTWWRDDEVGRRRSESEWRAGLRHGRTREWDTGQIEFDQRYVNNLALPVVRWSGAPGVVKLHKSEFGNQYEVPREVRAALRPGMSAAAVSKLLRVDFSLKEGITIANVSCEDDLEVWFKRGRVAGMKRMPNGSHCEPLEL